MPNIKSAAKRVLVAKRNNAHNKVDKSVLKTNVRKFEAAVAEGNREAAESAYKVAVKSFDKAAVKGVVHTNNAANKKSGMSAKLNAMAK